MATVDGTCDARFEQVRATSAANLEQGLDVGASVTVSLDGETVVVDFDQRLCVSDVMNRMGEGTQGDVRGAGLVFATYAAIGA